MYMDSWEKLVQSFFFVLFLKTKLLKKSIRHNVKVVVTNAQELSRPFLITLVCSLCLNYHIFM